MPAAACIPTRVVGVSLYLLIKQQCKRHFASPPARPAFPPRVRLTPPSLPPLQDQKDPDLDVIDWDRSGKFDVLDFARGCHGGECDHGETGMQNNVLPYFDGIAGQRPQLLALHSRLLIR